MRNGISFLLALALPLVAAWTAAQEHATNYDEARVGSSTLPDPLALADGGRVTDAQAWQGKRRAEVLDLFRAHVYGRTPEAPLAVNAGPIATDPAALGGRAVREQVTLRLGSGSRGPALDLLVYRPADARGPVPIFLGLNFDGNHTVNADPGISLPRSWVAEGTGVVDHRATEAGRGRASGSWPIERIVKRGYAVVTAYYGDLDPDYDDGFQNGIQPLFYRPGQVKPQPDEWGSIGAWAWGLSRALDWLEMRPSIFDAKRVAVTGHSRLGKTALWAGAQDERFALVVSNDSGEGGAALSRRNYGETVADLNRAFPHWFCGNYHRYSQDVAALPVDQHMLLALVAPRPLYVASATEDRWADPKGEFLAAKAAEPVYRLFGLEGLGVEAQPPAGKPVGRTIGYHLRAGKHDLTSWDWDRYLDFADRQLAAKKER